MKLAGRSEHTIVSHEKNMFSVHQFSRSGISHSHVPALAKKIPGGLQQCQAPSDDVPVGAVSEGGHFPEHTRGNALFVQALQQCRAIVEQGRN